MQPYFSSCLVIRKSASSEVWAASLCARNRTEVSVQQCCESVATLPAFWRVSLCTILGMKLIYNSSHSTCSYSAGSIGSTSSTSFTGPKYKPKTLS